MQKSEIRENVQDWQSLMFLYNSAIRVVRTKLDIINDELNLIYQYSPIEYIKSRIKTPESIVKKLKRLGHDTTIQNMVDYVNDIAGIRVVCSFATDIYRLADMIGGQQEFSILYIKDYIKHPKPSGYRSYHMHLLVPIQTSGGVIPTKVEIQIRTIAMDFWASLEHQIHYKFEGEAPNYISHDLQVCAQIVANLDDKMVSLHEEMRKAEKKQKERQVLSAAVSQSAESPQDTGATPFPDKVTA